MISLFGDIFYTRNMKNAPVFALVSIIFFTLVTGCSWWNPLASKPETNSRPAANNQPANETDTTKEKPLDEKAIDTVVGDEKIGVPECDELFDQLAKELETTDEGYIAKAARAYFYNTIREEIKKSIEENKNDKDRLAKECKDFKAQVDKYKAQENSNKQ